MRKGKVIIQLLPISASSSVSELWCWEGKNSADTVQTVYAF
jgi:hypothetical protein